jgi:hypothetical protein
MRNDGTFTIGCWRHSGKWWPYSISGQEIPADVIALFSGEKSRQGIKSESVFDVVCEGCVNPEEDNAYSLHCYWLFEEGDKSACPASGYGVHLVKLEKISMP